VDLVDLLPDPTGGRAMLPSLRSLGSTAKATELTEKALKEPADQASYHMRIGHLGPAHPDYHDL